MSNNKIVVNPNTSLEQILPFSHMTAESNQAKLDMTVPALVKKKSGGRLRWIERIELTLYFLEKSKFIEITYQITIYCSLRKLNT